MFNTVPVVSALRQPRGLVLANGERLDGLVMFAVDNNSFYQADTFRLTLALSKQRKDRDFSFWSQQEKIEIELFVGFPTDPDNFGKSDLTSLLVGWVDDIEIDPISDEIRMTGRDLTSVFVDNKTFEKYPNLTSSQIAQKIGAAHGLTVVATPTKTKAGSYYQIDHVSRQDSRPEWDLLTYLASREQYQVYVSGKTLHFEPLTSPNSGPYVIQWQAPNADSGSPILNARHIRFSRNLSIARDITVTVRSYNMKQKKGFTVTANRTRIKNQVGKASKQTLPVQQYFYTFPNLTPQQAQIKANELLAELSKHEMNMSASMPGDIKLTARNIIKMQGTGTAFDQTYYLSSVIRTYSLDEGFMMEISAKNHTPESTVQP